MTCSLDSFCLQGLTVHPVQVEVSLHAGMPLFNIIGMAGTSIQESKDRVRAAIEACGAQFPLTRKIVNLAPADLNKTGSHFDLAMAIGLLVESGQILAVPKGTWLLGELGLEGSLRSVQGLIPALLFARTQGATEIILPYEDLTEASLVRGLKLFPANNLKEVWDHFRGTPLSEKRSTFEFKPVQNTVDFDSISGQTVAKRALMIAASGKHHVLMNGPPGSGKSLLAEAFSSILPMLTEDESLEVMSIHSVAGRTKFISHGMRPFRTVHSRSSVYSLLGGGHGLSPGEVSLAHLGVLFLDEMPEFDPHVLESLRGPLEGKVLNHRVGKRTSSYPCNFQLLATMNPCPCGYFGDSEKACNCLPREVARYQNKLSGPIMDRIDMQISVPRLAYQDFKLKSLESSSRMRERVLLAQERERLRQQQGIDPKTFLRLDLKTDEILREASKRHALSGRAIQKIIKVARTIADIEEKDWIEASHLLEALQYRLPS